MGNDTSKSDKIKGRRATGGDCWAKHLRKDGKRRANKASRRAGRVR